MPTEIVVGLELDRLVAEAIGWEARESGPWERWDEPPRIRTVAVDESGDIHWIDGGPSVNLNAAFAAAERVGLFDEDGPEATLKRYPAAEVTWTVVWEDGGAQDGYQAVYAPTPALAICAAILKLKEE